MKRFLMRDLMVYISISSMHLNILKINEHADLLEFKK